MPPKRMTANPVRPARYRAGKPLPGDRSESSGDEDDEEEGEEEAEAEIEKPQEPAPKQAGKIISTGLAKVDLNQRFQKTSDDEESSEEEDEDEDDDEDKEDEDAAKQSSRFAPSGDYESDDSDSDSDDSSEEEEAPKRKLIRPTFIPKSKRNVQASTTADPTASSESAAAARKAEAHNLVESAIRREAVEKNAKSKQLDSDMTYTEPPDDTDDLDPVAERAAWRLRELLRIKRARDAIEQMEKEREEVEARRNMDADERMKQDMEFVAKQREEANEKKGKMGFMQKFYHKGAFYQDESELLQRNYATARVEDEVVNREVLPKALQVRGYDQLGKRGQTKWTHLAAEDTTNLGREDGYGWGAGKRKGKFEDIPGMRDERFMTDKVRERRDREREGNNGGDSGRRDERRDDRRRDDHRRDRDNGDTHRPGGGDRRRDRDGDDFRRRERDGSRERQRERSRSPRRDRFERRDRDHDSSRGGRRSDHDREDRRGGGRDDDRGGGSYRSRWDQQDKPDRKRGGDDVQLDEKRRKIEA